MKNKHIAAGLGLFLATAILGLSCSSPLSSVTGPKTSLSLSLHMGTAAGAKTIGPDPADVTALIAKYSVLLSRTGYADINQIFTGSSGNIADLDQGDWSLVVSAKTTDNYIVAQGSTTVTLVSPGPNMVSLPLAWTGAGQTSVTFFFPNSVGITDATGSIGGFTPTLSVIPATISDVASCPAWSSSSKVLFAMASIDPGSPMLQVDFFAGTEPRATFHERTWIYPQLSTTAVRTLAATFFADPPTAPSPLTATPVVGGTIQLDWTDSCNNAEAYLIYKSADAGTTYTQLGVDLAPFTETYTDTVGTGGGTYLYRVSARNRVGERNTDVSAVYDTSVETDSAALTVGYANPDSAASVTQSVSLPAVGANGSQVAWFSDNTGRLVVAPVAVGGNYATTITRPFLDDAAVTLTAIVSKGLMSTQTTFALTIKKYTDAEAVAMAKPEIAVGYTAPDSAGNVISNLSLPSAASYDTQVTWTSGTPAVIAISTGLTNSRFTGTVTRPNAADATVLLTATVSRGTTTDSTRTFSLTVKATASGGITITPILPTAAAIVFEDAANATITSFTVIRGTPATVHATLAGATYLWTLDNSGTATATAQSCAVDPAALYIGRHTLFLTAVSAGKTYTGRIQFTVLMP